MLFWGPLSSHHSRGYQKPHPHCGRTLGAALLPLTLIFPPDSLGAFSPIPCSPRAPEGVQRGCCRLRAAALSGGSRERPPRRAAAAGPGMLRRLPGCDLRSGQEGAGEARARERARGARGWGQPSAPGGASQKVQDQPHPALPHLSAPPPELGERLVPLPALRFHASVSLHPFPPKNFL